MIVIDASVLIAHLDADDGQHDRAQSLLSATGDAPLWASRLTLAEVLVGPARAGKLEVAMAALVQLGINGVGLDTDAPARLAGIRAQTRLSMPDCCVLLAAEQLGARVASFDDSLVAAVQAMGLAVLEV